MKLMKIVLDMREHDLFEHVQQQVDAAVAAAPAGSMAAAALIQIEVSKEALPLGDVIIRDADNNDLVIVERKTINDLLASIRDGRYHEQSHRLLRNGGQYHHHNVIYMIEGILSSFNPETRRTIYGAITSLNYNKGFSVLRTSTLKESAELLVAMTYKICNKRKREYIAAADADAGADADADADAAADMNATTYVHAAAHKVRRMNVTPENIWEFMLSQIPFVSTHVAQHLLSQFHTVPLLCDALRNNPDCLRDIKIPGREGKGTAAPAAARKIGSHVIESLKQYLLCGNNTTSSSSSSRMIT